MPESPAHRTPRPGSRRWRFQRTFALCPACKGEGAARIPCGGWAECAVCEGRGSVPPFVRAAVAVAPCEGCLGSGRPESGECCALCSGLGYMVISLRMGGKEAPAA
ncbi:MAG: hypothetical protein ACKOWF_00300 [Chloroflexota bacterium]